MKGILCAVFALVFLFAQVPTASAVGTCASSAILMDADSGRVLYEQQAHQQRLIASTTKLMTALVALESGHRPDEMVTVLPEWVGVEGSSIYLKAGEQVSLETLLYGMLLRSGNDAALAVAGHCGGTQENFAASMNRKAQQLGMTNSSFSNPHGLNAPDHYSTAYDMALLARACLAHEALASILATKSITIGTKTFTNHNKLLWRYDGCIGLKTGYTEKAGRTLVSAARRNETTLICVTLDDPDDWKDHTALFNYGFERYHTQTLLSAETEVGQLWVENSLVSRCGVVSAETVCAAVAQGETVEVRLELEQQRMCAPIAKGQKVGQAVIFLDGREQRRVDLLSASEVAENLVEEDGLWSRIKEYIFS